jgi:hypothetical protein
LSRKIGNRDSAKVCLRKWMDHLTPSHGKFCHE